MLVHLLLSQRSLRLSSIIFFSFFSLYSSPWHYFYHSVFHLYMAWLIERLRAGGEGEDRGWEGWMASPTQWTWVWANSRRWWRTRKPGVLQPVESRRVGHDWATEQQQQSSRSLFHSSASVILLSILSRVFLISVIVLLITICLFFISSRSLLNVSCIFSILFLISWNFFSIITLNSFSDRLPISSLFTWSCRFFFFF